MSALFSWLKYVLHSLYNKLKQYFDIIKKIFYNKCGGEGHYDNFRTDKSIMCKM